MQVPGILGNPQAGDRRPDIQRHMQTKIEEYSSVNPTPTLIFCPAEQPDRNQFSRKQAHDEPGDGIQFRMTAQIMVSLQCKLVPVDTLAGGMLGGALKKAKEGRRAAEHVQKSIEKNREALEKYEALCKDLGEEPADVALAWLLHNPVVTAPIIGPRTSAQLKGNIHSLSIELESEILEKLDEIWPGPGGEAPEAYAW